MKVLFPIIIFSLFMAYIAERRSVCKINKYGKAEYIKKDKLFWFLMTLGMGIFCGLRLKGNDTGLYRRMYLGYELGVFDIDWEMLAEAPGFTFIGIVLRTMGASVQDYLIIVSVFTVYVYLWFIRKYTTDLWLSVFYFITMGVYTFTFAAIKQTLAVAFLLIATDRAINKKYINFVFWVLIAELFHPYAFVYLIIPFLFFEPWTPRTYAILGGTVVISAMLSRLLEGVLTMTESIGYQYTEGAFSGDGVNAYRVLVVWVPTILSFLVRFKYKGKLDRGEQLIINASMINSVIMFIGLFGTANYFARLANYFLIFQVLSLPLLFRYFNIKNRNILKVLSFLFYSMYFYYATDIVHGAFGNTYQFMNFLEYLGEHIH